MSEEKEEKKKGLPVTKCTEELINEMARAVMIGTPITQAAVFCGVTYQTFYKWCQLADPKMPGHKPIFAVLHDTLERAKAQALVRRLKKCDEIAEGVKGVPLYDQVVEKVNGKDVILKKIARHPVSGNIDWESHPQKPDPGMNKFLVTSLAPNDFAPPTKLEHTGKDGGPIKTESKFSNMSEDEIDKELARLDKIIK